MGCLCYTRSSCPVPSMECAGSAAFEWRSRPDAHRCPPLLRLRPQARPRRRAVLHRLRVPAPPRARRTHRRRHPARARTGIQAARATTGRRIGDVAKRPCIEPHCPALTTGTRCPTHQQAYDQQRWAAKGGRYNGAWRGDSKQAIADHVAQHGMTCPGWNVPAHSVKRSEFVTDHDCGVMCRSCNSRKAASYDKQR